MKLAFVYDRINKIGGAERILQTLHKLYPNSYLYTAVYHPERAKWAKGWKIRTSFINQISFARSTHELYPWLTPIAFESFDFSGFDVVVSITSAEAKGIITQPGTIHLCYCLTPTRYLWSDHSLYKEEVNVFLRPLALKIFKYLKRWDKLASQRPDKYFAISETTRKRIKKYYGKSSEVIYPPVNLEKFQRRVKKNISMPCKNFFLVVSRLVPYKKVELAIDACNKLGKSLVVVGAGVQMKKLKKISGPLTHFTGELTEQELVLYYQQCDALLFPQEEDFGISIVEAQAAGKPVIAYNKGGATEIIDEGRTGLFFSNQTTNSLIKAIKQFKKRKYDRNECQKNADRFSEEAFSKKFSLKVEEIWQESQKIER